MSKKVIITLLAAVMLLTSVACSGPSGQSAAGPAPPSEVVADPTVDVDLSVMSSTMVYAKLFDMLVQPDNYYEQTIKVKGNYGFYYIEEIDKYLHTVMVADASECCEQGVEFIWVGDHIYPDDYPERGTMIEISGMYKFYFEENSPVFYIETEGLTVL